MLVACTTTLPCVPGGGNGSQRVREAFDRGKWEKALRLVAGGAGVDLLNEGEKTMLLLAAVDRDKEDVVQVLIEKGARVNGEKDGLTPLVVAMIKSNRAVFQRLIEGRADVDFVDRQERLTPLLRAVAAKRSDWVQMVIASKANVDLPNRDGATALYGAVKLKSREIAQILLDAKADVNAYDKAGYTSLHKASSVRCMPLVRLLCEHGAIWNVPTGYEVSEMRVLAAAWGIGGEANINGKMIERDSASGRRPELWVMGDALQMYLPEIAAAFNADQDLDPRKRLGKIQSGALVVISTGYDIHAMTVVFYKGYLAICNRWKDRPTRVYKIDPSKVTKGLLKSLNDIVTGDKETAFRFLYKELPHALRATQKDPICRILNHGQRHLKAQEHGFCAYDTSEAALYVSLAFILLPRGWSIQDIRISYKFCTTHLRFYFLHGYLNQVENGRLKKEGVDFVLMGKIGEFLENPKWQPKRFVYPLFNANRGSTLARLKQVTFVYGGP